MLDKLTLIYMSPIKRKRSDTKISTIEKKYNIDLKVRSDMKLGTYLKREGLPSLSKLVKKKSVIKKSKKKK